MTSHYEVRKTGSVTPEYRTGSNTETEFENACRRARELSAPDPHTRLGTPVRYEVRYRGYGDLARDLLVAAAQGGEMLDIRTRQSRDEHESR